MTRLAKKPLCQQATTTASRFALFLVLSAAGLAACGDASDGVGNGACDTPGITQNEVVAGLLYPGSGPLSPEFTAFRSGVDARLGLANAEGGVGNRQISYVVADDEASLTTNLAAARGLVEDSHVFGIMEISAAAAGSAQWLNQNGIPVTGHADESVWTSYHNMFSYSYLLGTDGGVDTFGQFAKRAGGTRAVIISIPDSELSTKMGDALAASLEAAGVPVVARITETPGITDPKTTAARIVASRANVVAGFSTESDFANSVNLAREAGANVLVPLAPNGYGSLSPTLSWPDGAYSFLEYHPFETASPAIKRFQNAMSAYAPQAQESASNVAMHGWVAADMFLTGLKAAGPCPTRASFIAGLRAVKDYDADGLTVNKVDFANFGSTDRCFSFVRYDATAKVANVVAGADPFCGKQVTAQPR